MSRPKDLEGLGGATGAARGHRCDVCGESERYAYFAKGADRCEQCARYAAEMSRDDWAEYCAWHAEMRRHPDTESDASYENERSDAGGL